MASPAAAKLPPEILFLIAKQIPRYSLLKLYSVNSVFLNLALNERYKEVCLEQEHPESVKLLENIRDLNLSSRVHQLRIDTLWFEEIVPDDLAPASPASQESFPPEDIGPRSDRRIYIDNLTTELVTQFSNITSLAIKIGTASHLPFLRNTWQTFGSKLRRLTITGTPGGMAAVLPPPSKLASLQNLTMEILRAYNRSNDASEVISTFLCQLAPQLRSFNFSTSFFSRIQYEIFRKVGRMPYLNTVSLKWDDISSGEESVLAFLINNSQNLKHVRLLQEIHPFNDGSSNSNIITDTLSERDFLTDLETLVIPPSDRRRVPLSKLDGLALYIPRSKDTLTSLVLGEVLSFAGLKELVECFDHRIADQGLKLLHIKLISLNPQVFDLLAVKLEGLDDLKIQFNKLFNDVKYEDAWIMNRKIPKPEGIYDFLDEMSGRVYANWKLYTLCVFFSFSMSWPILQGNELSDEEAEISQQISKGIMQSIPSLRVISHPADTHPIYHLFD